jgi:uncharacterized protein YkwD
MRVFFGKARSATLALLVLAALTPISARASETDDAILAEINFARENPQAYAWQLLMKPISDWEQELGPNGPATDSTARTEAIAFLMRQTPLPPLQSDDKLAAAALEHVADQGPVGAIGHDGPTGERFDARIRRHGVPAALAAENIAYGPARPSDVVRELIIDSGVPNRGHRRNIFYDGLEYAGVSCGPHKDYAAMCVIDFVGLTADPASWRDAAAELRPASPGGPRYRLFNGQD